MQKLLQMVLTMNRSHPIDRLDHVCMVDFGLFMSIC